MCISLFEKKIFWTTLVTSVDEAYHFSIRSILLYLKRSSQSISLDKCGLYFTVLGLFGFSGNFLFYCVGLVIDIINL